jgi:hypothetical protein
LMLVDDPSNNAVCSQRKEFLIESSFPLSDLSQANALWTLEVTSPSMTSLL